MNFERLDPRMEAFDLALLDLLERARKAGAP